MLFFNRRRTSTFRWADMVLECTLLRTIWKWTIRFYGFSLIVSVRWVALGFRNEIDLDLGKTVLRYRCFAKHDGAFEVSWKLCENSKEISLSTRHISPIPIDSWSFEYPWHDIVQIVEYFCYRIIWSVTSAVSCLINSLSEIVEWIWKFVCCSLFQMTRPVPVLAVKRTDQFVCAL